MSQSKVTLLLPGYTQNSPVGNITEGDHQSPASFYFSEDLDRQPWQAQLAQILGFDTVGGKRLPSARLGLLRDNKATLSRDPINTSGVVRADPIFLKADRDSATLIPAEQLALSEEDSVKLIESLNEFVAEDGLFFFSQSPGEWYMSGRSADVLECYPPSYLANRKASSFLPDGDSAAPWRSLMTEIQMLLHSHPVNEQRQQRGLMPVNSVWFWGGAQLPSVTEDRANIVFYADASEVKALAGHLGVTCLPLLQFYSDVNEEFTFKDIVVIDLSVVQAWLDADAQQLDRELARIHGQWLHPLARQISAGQLRQVHVMTEDGHQGLCDEHTQIIIPNKALLLINRIRNLFSR